MSDYERMVDLFGKDAADADRERREAAAAGRAERKRARLARGDVQMKRPWQPPHW